MLSNTVIAPSILAADFARLADSAAAVEGAADWLHVDVMDNHFVPNLTIGLPVVQSLRKATTLPFDCHLMIADPARWAAAYAEAGRVQRDLPRRGGDGPGRAGQGPAGGRAAGPGWRSTGTRRSRRTWTCCRTSTCCSS